MSHLTTNTVSSIRRTVVVVATLLISAGVCLSPVQAQSGSAAKLVQMTGQVSVLRGNATWALNVGDVIQPQQFVVTGPDGSATFQVADGSTFEVFPNSKAIFRETMGDWRDLLKMVMGRVRVEIQHLGGQPNPNKVRTATAVISVRGTIFDVTVEDEDGTTLVLVEEGRVQVQHLLQPGMKMLERGESVEVFWNQPLAAAKVDHGPVYQQVIRAAKDAMYQILMNSRGATGAAGTPGTTPGGTGADKGGNPTGGTTGGGTTSGGTTGGTAPPPAPPPPPH